MKLEVSRVALDYWVNRAYRAEEERDAIRDEFAAYAVENIAVDEYIELQDALDEAHDVARKLDRENEQLVALGEGMVARCQKLRQERDDAIRVASTWTGADTYCSDHKVLYRSDTCPVCQSDEMLAEAETLIMQAIQHYGREWYCKNASDWLTRYRKEAT